MYVVYILKSINTSRYYVGHTKNIEQRIRLHNNSRVRSTKCYAPWNLIYTETFSNKNSAYKRELIIKSYKGGEAFRKLIKNNAS